MAGYMTKLQGRVYDGSHLAAEELQNGMFAEITADGVKATAAAKDTVLRVAEKTALWGKEALVLDVASTGADEVFLVENEFDNAADANYDNAAYVIAKGEFVRMHRLLPGDQLIVNVGTDVYAAATIGATMAPAAKGAVAAKG